MFEKNVVIITTNSMTPAKINEIRLVLSSSLSFKAKQTNAIIIKINPTFTPILAIFPTITS